MALDLDLDLDGDGVETTPADGNILFDHDADGLKTGTGWLSADDAWLVRDLDGNGTIDSGRELFGVDTQVPGGTATDGFAAARMLDSNADGQLSAADAAWNELKLWRDLNQDGISQAGELQSLDAHGVASISLHSSLQDRNLGNGNVILYGGEYTRTDGSTGLTNALNLGQDTFHREYVDPLPISEAAAALPDLQGSGQVRDLREAMSQSPQLLALVQRFAQATSSSEQAALVGQIVLAWGETSPLQGGQDGFMQWQDGHAYRLTYADRDVVLTVRDGQDHAVLPYVETLERFNGRTLVSGPGENDPFTWNGLLPLGTSSNNGSIADLTYYGLIERPQLDLLMQAWRSLAGSVYQALAVQTRQADWFDQVELVFDETGVRMDFGRLDAQIAAAAEVDAAGALLDLLTFVSAHGGDNLAHMGWDYRSTLARVATQADPAALADLQLDLNEFDLAGVNGATGPLQGGAGQDALFGAAGHDTLEGAAGNDLLLGGAGDDRLVGGDDSANDTLIGGTGSDFLQGDGGADLYGFRRGDGADTIESAVHDADETDTLVFGPGIAAADLSFRRVGNDLVIGYGAGDSITVKYHYGSPNWASYAGLKQVVFDGGSLQSLQALISASALVLGDAAVNSDFGAAADWIVAGAGNDTIAAGDGDNRVYGNGGDDALSARWGADLLDGGAGDDRLDGDIGADTLVGGTGSDWMNGASGNDTYRLALGDGADIIESAAHDADEVDTLVFGQGIAAADLAFHREGNDLIVAYGAGDAVTVKHHYGSPNWSSYAALKQIVFADGSTARLADLLADMAMAMTGTDGADYPSLTDAREVYRAGAGNDTVQAYGGNDVLDGGTGNDYLDGGYGDDLLDGGAGNDRLLDTEGADTYMFERGDGNDTINDNSSTSQPDTLRFGSGIGLDDLTFQMVDKNLVIRYGGTDTVAILNHYGFGYPWYGANRIERLQLADGTDLDLSAAVAAKGISGSSDSETLEFDDNGTLAWAGGGSDGLYGGNGDDSLYGEGGNDLINAGGGDDLLIGGSGADRLYGVAGDDRLEGGAGDDTLYGGAGNDRYDFGRGDGNDWLGDSDGDQDTVRFGTDVTGEQLWFRRAGSDLVVDVVGTDDRLTVQDWYQGSAYRVESFETADGKVLLQSQVDALVQAMAGLTPPPLGQLTLAAEQQQALAPVLAASWH
ncbi:calcium-binding protein [Chitinimonas koreensis]|uniref:calcium-binding protein n=1 Tax=Chitinimonas koreensis TaxID=356302 RepID=UPI00146FAA1B|nr:calcium-binding protein [Chitinimonas koreensis]